MPVISYFPDGTRTTQPTESAFLFVQLNAVEQNLNDPNLGKFSSRLIANISQLQSNSVTEISCSDPAVLKTVPINLQVIQRSVPNSPEITMVTSTYQFGEISSVSVTWIKSVSYYYIVQFMQSNVYFDRIIIVHHMGHPSTMKSTLLHTIQF